MSGSTELSTLGLTKNAITVLESRYLLRDENGTITETPLQMFQRVAGYVVQAEDKYRVLPERRAEIEEEFLRSMVALEFLPNSPTFTGAGTRLGQLAACFVLPQIYEATQSHVLIFALGGASMILGAALVAPWGGR